MRLRASRYITDLINVIRGQMAGQDRDVRWRQKFHRHHALLVRALLALSIVPGVQGSCASVPSPEERTASLNRTIKETSRTIAKNPVNERAYVLRGYAKGELGDLQGAVEDHTRAIMLNPLNPEPLYQRGVINIRRGHREDGILDLSRAIRLDPQFQEAYLSRGVAKCETGACADGLKDLTRAIQINPRDSMAFISRGW